MVLPLFSYFEFTLGWKYCGSWLVFEPNCAYVISLYCFYCGKNKWHIRVKSSVVDSAACYSSSWDQAKGIIMFIYAMHISEICSSHCSGIQTRVILWQLITTVIRNLIKYPLILPFSGSISSGGWFGFSISHSLTQEVKHGWFLASFEVLDTAHQHPRAQGRIDRQHELMWLESSYKVPILNVLKK